MFSRLGNVVSSRLSGSKRFGNMRMAESEFSFAVVHGNATIEDQNQVVTGVQATSVASRYLSNHLFAHLGGGHVRETETVYFTDVGRKFGNRPISATSGSSCLIGVIRSVANLGDSKAVLGYLDGSDAIVSDHNGSTVKDLHHDDPQIILKRQGVWRVKGIAQLINHIGRADGDEVSEGDDDVLLWSRDLKNHPLGEFSFAVVQGNATVEDHSQVVTKVNNGHGGPEASRYVSNYLFANLSGHARICEDIIKTAFSGTISGIFLTNVGRKFGGRIAMVGSCCLVANLGDSGAVIAYLDRSDNIVSEQITTHVKEVSISIGDAYLGPEYDSDHQDDDMWEWEDGHEEEVIDDGEEPNPDEQEYDYPDDDSDDEDEDEDDDAKGGDDDDGGDDSSDEDDDDMEEDEDDNDE